LGVTSRGIFLRVEPNRVVFLSRERYRGPLTVNLPHLPELDLENGQPVAVQAGRIQLPGYPIDVPAAPIWQAAPLALDAPPGETAWNRLQFAARLAVETSTGSGLSSLLVPLLDLPLDLPAPCDPELQARLLELPPALRAEQFTAAAPLLIDLLGRGSGLTPSGDDLALGFLLALNRCRAWFGANDEIERVNRLVLDAARRATTTLSANLIAAALLGQADERLIAALDAILTGRGQLPESIQVLLAWGHSSGGDALLGMALFLTALPDRPLSPLDLQESV
jgi:hypothetical protein